MCKELVFIKKDEVLTDSLTISDRSNYKHSIIQRKARDFKDDFEEFGKLGFENRPLPSGQKQKVYIFNEMQAAYMITLLDNNEVVRAFKKSLVKGFYVVKQALLEKQSTEWKQTRKKGKLTRRDEMDIIATHLIPLAIEQGSKNYNKLYVNYTRLVNLLLELPPKSRDKATWKTLRSIEVLENMIEGTIKEECEKGTYYKDIYTICKAKGTTMAKYLYLDKTKLLLR